VVVDPAQLLLELIRSERHPAEDTEPTRIAHRGDDVTAVAEGEQRELDAELLADLCFHRTSMRPGTVRLTAMVRMAMALALGVLAAVLTGTVRHEWHYSPAVGWIVAATVYLATTWLVVAPLDGAQTENHVRQRHEDGTPTVSHLVVLIASIASLVGVGYLLAAAGEERQLGEAAIGVLSVIAAWLTVHTTFMLRYAQLYYLGGEPDVIAFHQSDYRPRFLDFAYLAFTVGMTYQVSDTDLASRPMRGSVLAQGLVSFVLGAVVLASTINLVLELAGR
jgi:uncharacterized membrane protein